MKLNTFGLVTALATAYYYFYTGLPLMEAVWNGFLIELIFVGVLFVFACIGDMFT